MYRLRLILVMLLAWIGIQAGAETVKNLIVERAEATYGSEMPSKGRFKLRIPDGTVTEAEYLSQFWIDRTSGRFVAIVVTGKGLLQRVTGVALLEVPVPVTKRRMLPNEIIQSSDLKIVDIPHARVSTFAVTDAKDLVGMQVRRVLSQGRPIQRQSVSPPIVVTRGSKVTIRFTSGPLFLSARGRALSDAYLGEELRVTNLESNKTITTIARGNGIVEVLK